MSDSATVELRRTALKSRHRASNARMVAYAGWDMPVEYSGITAEHLAVRTRAGIFDVSHMGEIEIAGKNALAAVQRISSNDASRLAIGQIQYAGLLTPAGTFIDDMLVYRIASSHFMLVVNAANAARDYAWIAEQVAPVGDAAVVDSSSRYALISIQGPASAETLQPLTGVDLANLRYYWYAHGEVASARAMVSRTGYSGEDGFEIFVPPNVADRMWLALLDSGRAADVIPCGLGARDTLRLEAAMRLYGNDIDESTTALEAGLEWIVAWNKDGAIGVDSLREPAAHVDVDLGTGRGHVDRDIRHPDRFLEIRRLRAARHDANRFASAHHGVTVTRDAAIDHLKADQLSREARFLLFAQGIPADEFLVPAERPAKTRFERRRRLVDVVAVQAHRRLETKRIARPQTDRDDVDGAAGLEQPSPDRVGHVRRHKDLESVFAGVSRPCHRDPGIRNVAMSERERWHLIELDRAERLEHFLRCRTLDRDQRVAAARVDDGRIAGSLDLLADPGVILRSVRGVDHEQEMGGSHSVDDQVVDVGTARCEQTGILRLPHPQPAGVVARYPLDGREGVLAGDLELAHVADIEQPCPGPHGQMLVDDARVLDRHVPACKWHHPGVGRAVAGVERGLAEFGGGRLCH